MKKLIAKIFDGQLFVDAEQSITDENMYELWIQTIEKGMTYETNIAG